MNTVSLWEQESLLTFDVIIVGAGISGLSTAASLAGKNPKLDILILEKGTLPSGASTKNAGFACFGSVSELLEDCNTLGDQGMVSLVEQRWKGLQFMSSRLGEKRIGLERKGGYELLSPDQESSLSAIDHINDLLKPLFNKPVFELRDKKIKPFGFGQTQHLIFNPLEGQLHTGKLIRSLWSYCSEKGVRILTGTKVAKIEPTDAGVHLDAGDLTFTAKAAAVCTNAFTSDLLQKPLDIKPGRGMVMLIRPTKPLQFEGTFHYESGYYYFRDYADKIIFGGGRNLDLEGETTTEFGINDLIREKLYKDLSEKIIPGQDFQEEMSWSGIMAFGQNKQPMLREVLPNVFTGVRLGGMGITIGALVGEDLANMIHEGLF